MPLEKAKEGTPGFSRNIATEMKAGKPKKQAVAIAYNKAREDSATADCVYEKNGEFFFEMPGFKDHRGPFASESEAKEAAVKAGVVADAEVDAYPKPGEKAHTLQEIKRDGAEDARYGQPYKNPYKDPEEAKAYYAGYSENVKIKSRADADDGKEHWVTMNGSPVLVGEDGEIKGGAGGKFNGQKVGGAETYTGDAYRYRGHNTAQLNATKKILQSNIARMTGEAAKTKDASNAKRYLEIAEESKRDLKDLEAAIQKNDARRKEASSKARIEIRTKTKDGNSGRKDSDTEADAAVSFDKGNPEKPWSVKVGSSIKRFAFRQQAEAAARGDAEVDAGVSEFGKAIEAAQKAHNLGISRGAFKSQLVGMKASSSEIERYLSAYDNWKSRGDAEVDSAVDKYIKSSGDRAKYLALTPEEKAKVNKWLEDGYYYPEAVKKAGIFNRGDAEVDAGERTLAQAEEEIRLVKRSLNNAYAKNGYKVGGSQDKMRRKFETLEAEIKSIKSRKDSAKADSTPTIVREGDQWIIVVTDGAEKSVFRLGVREYPTEAEALEYATTNPQYTNNKPTSALDSLMAACDSLYAKADEIERRLDAAGDQRFSVVYINSADKEATIVVRAKHNVDAKKVAKEHLGGEIKDIRRVDQLPDRRSDAERDLPGAGTSEGGYSDADEIERRFDAVCAYDKDGKLVGRYKSMEQAKQLKPGHEYRADAAGYTVEKTKPSDRTQGAWGVYYNGKLITSHTTKSTAAYWMAEHEKNGTKS